MNTIAVQVDGATLQVARGTTAREILRQAGVAGEPLVAALNDHLVCLDTPVDGDASLRAVGPDDREGAAVLRRTITHAFLAAAHRRAPQLRLRVGQSLLGGYFFEVEPAPLGAALEALALELEEGLHELARAETPFQRWCVPVESALRELGNGGASKAALLETWTSPQVPLVSLDGFTDVQHGPFALTAACASQARVRAFAPGLVLQFSPEPPEAAASARLLWSCYRETRDWNRRVGVATVGELNRAVLQDRVGEVIRVAEALHEKKIAEIADAIAERRARVVFVAGPSASGKTTFVERLAVQLRVNGIRPTLVGLDDYYRDRNLCPRDTSGRLDFEALEALDLELFEEQMGSLLRGTPTRLPRFDFTAGKPTPPETWREVALAPDQVLVVEGIHGLNPRLIGAVPPEQRFAVFVSALTQLQIDDHNRIFTADGRLLRRLVRDRRYRGTPGEDTLMRWKSVRRGEGRHIFPHQHQADTVFNSALIYEPAVLKTFAWRYLLEVPRGSPARPEAYRLLKFLELFAPVFPDGVPANSVLREFLGGSDFAYATR